MNTTQLPSVSELQRLSLSDLETFAQSASGHATKRWLTLGRCFLVLGQNGRVEQFGCSGTTQYAGLLGIKKQDARECKRVASALEELPALRAAAEAGGIGWGALCEVTKSATAETDAHWLKLAQRYTLTILERLVEATPWGEQPGDPETTPSHVPEESWMHLKVPAHVAAMFQRAVRQLSLQARTPVSAALCQELVLAEFLAGLGASRDAVEKLRQEARKDVTAQRRRGSAQQLLLETESPPEKQGNDEALPETPIRNPASSDHARSEVPVLDDDAPEPPLAALAGRGAICPSQTDLRLLVPDTDTQWENPRLRFSEEARLATPAQRREMLRRDGYRCSVPGCPHHLWLDLHHVVFYCEGGVTLPDNLIVVCSKCHRNIHKGRLTVTGTAPDGLQWKSRRGHGMDRPLPLDDEEEDNQCDGAG